LQYTPGFNVNGIAASADGRYLLLAKSNSGELYRVRVADGAVQRVDLGGETVSGDGLVLTGSTLYAVERVEDLGRVVEIEMASDLLTGSVVHRVTDPGFDDPTTAALARGRLLVVNSQFGERTAGETPDPFTVSSIPAP
jgi:Cu-Zn family superoxide dismutase